MNINDIIFAPITALGGAVVVIRISGKDCLRVFFEEIKTNKSALDIKEKYCHLVQIFYQNQNECPILDEVIFVYFNGKKSFTGEDTIEVSLHGGSFIVNKFLEMLSFLSGFRFAKNGEFTKRAFLNGKIDLLKAESINSIIKSENRDQHFLSSNFFSGNISNIYLELRSNIINLISKIEVFIDFPEEDIPQEIYTGLDSLKQNIDKHLQKCKNINDINKIQNKIKIGFFGNANCGKSSLLNIFSKRDVAIVSNIKGTTRDVLTNEIKIKDESVIICDTAGIRNSKNLIEKEGIKRTLEILKDVDVRIFLFDSSIFFKNKDTDIINILKNNIKTEDVENIIILMTKSDLLKNDSEKQKIIEFWAELTGNLKLTKNLNIEFFSIKSEFFFSNLEEKLYNVIKTLKPNIENSLILNQRHYFIINKIQEELRKINLSEDIEILAEDLRNILFLIQEITGEIYNDDILDKIFREFCIGK